MPTLNQAPWDERVGGLWARRFDWIGLPAGATVVEVGPGFSAKVGYGLAAVGFRGTLVLVEPVGAARAWAVREHRRLLPHVVVQARRQPVPEVDGLGAVDVIVGNHVLDDMLLRRHLPVGDSHRLFSAMRPGRRCSPSFVQAWRSLLGSGELPAVVRQVVDDLVSYVTALAPGHVVLNEYPSWQHTRSHLAPIHEIAKETLHQLSRALATTGLHSTCHQATPMTWLTAEESG